MDRTLTINSDRLWSRIMDMAQYGALPAGGCNRQALTDEDKAGREQFTRWCKEIDCSIRIDAIGNIFARRPGADDSLAPVITGSHLDTQPSGGKFDGIYGVLAGLEVMQTIAESGTRPARPMEVVVWTNEEGCRFDTAMMGSAVWSGAMPLEEAYSLRDRDGNSVKQELERIGHLGEQRAAAGDVHAALELHIEQGPILEAENTLVGVVNGVQHMSRHRVIIHGQEAHAGPTPMTMRKDPMMALAKLLPELYGLSDQYAPDGRITFGYINATPGSSNTVPGRLELTVDIRHPDEASYSAMLEAYSHVVVQACSKFHLEHTLECFWQAPGISFDAACINAVRGAAESRGYSYREMVSGAGHDACNVSAVVATSMIFIPCAGGLSHNEAEYAAPEHLANGANVLLDAMLALARQ